MFGSRVLGEEGAAKEALKQNNGIGGGAIQFGERVLQGAAPKYDGAAKAAVDEVPPPIARPGATTRNRMPKAKPAKKGVAAPALVAFSEAEVETMLGDDPNVWPRVVEAESARAHVRPGVARMVLAVRETATDPALTTLVIAELEAVLAPRLAAPLTRKRVTSPRAAAVAAGIGS